MSNEIIRISNMAKQYEKVDTVMYALNKENLKQSAKMLAGNKAVGVDNVTKREYIPKAGTDKERPLGIPAFEDKIVQDVMAQVLKENTNAIREFYEKILWQLYKMLNRRSQKRSYNWQEYYQKIGKRINKPQIYVDIVRMSYVM